jgi:hypothetical protein
MSDNIANQLNAEELGRVGQGPGTMVESAPPPEAMSPYAYPPPGYPPTAMYAPPPPWGYAPPYPPPPPWGYPPR